MNCNLSKERSGFLVTLGLVGLVLTGIWYLTRDKKKRSINRNLTNEELMQVLISISNELHPIMMELSHLISTISKSFDQRSLEFINDIDVILTQGGFKDKVIKSQRKILDDWNIDEDHFEKMIISECERDHKVLSLKQGIDTMYQDALQGIYPLIPYLGSKTEFICKHSKYTQEYILELLEELNKKKENHFKDIIKDIGDPTAHTINHPIAGTIPSEELSKRLQDANTLSEDIVLGSEENKRLFTHAVAMYSRENEFLLKKQKLEQEHSDNILNIIMSCNK